jgi:hypothetical protein
MATGDQQDIFTRIKGTLPVKAWFADSTPLLDATLQGVAYLLAYAYSVYAYARQQTRILTATDGFLDVIASDFFGATIQRKTGQSDTSFRATILANIFREKATRKSIAFAVTQITGNAPVVLEPLRPVDTGAYGVAAYTGYGVAGMYGSMLLPLQSFVVAYRGVANGPAKLAGYGSVTGAYTTPSSADYLSAAQAASAIGDADIYAAIEATRPAGSQVWVSIQNH